MLQQKHFEKDSIALKKYLQPLAKTPLLSVLHQALLANGYSNYYDRINKRSDYYYLQSISNAAQIKNLPLEIWTQLNYVSYLYHYLDYTNMTPQLLEVFAKMKNITPNEMIFPGESFKKIGWIMQTIGDYEEASHYLKLAQTYTSKNTSEYASITDAIGINYLNTNHLQKAISYFNEAAKQSKKIKDSLRYAKVLGNLARVYQKKGDFKKAISLIKEDIAISEYCQSHQNTMFASIILAQLYLDTNNLEAADAALKKAEAISLSKSYFKNSELSIVKLKLALLQKLHKTDNELELRRRMSILENSIKTKNGSLVINNVNWIIEKTKFQQKLDQTNAQYKQESFHKNIYAFIALLLILLAFFIYLNFKKQLKNKQLEYKQKAIAMELEKLKIEQKLVLAHDNLNAQIDYLKNKNVQIKKLKNEIEHLKQSPSDNLEKKKGKLNALLESHLMTESNWNIFKREFQKEHSEFYNMLLTEFPELTDSNIRILLLQKLNFSNNETAELLGVTTEAIKKSKQRLKKKLGAKSDMLFDHISVKSA
ncbi:tetratricopeptide repeat protein [Flavobacterium sp. W1B]|uniref:tetratricopeptide repeat protein n=1 Tax=Flavobacterium sp. W1B TaxID=3394146 RepID=UPI0039BCE993